MLSGLEEALRREFGRASRYRQALAVLVVDLAPTADRVAGVRDGVRVCDVVLEAPGERIGVILPETSLEGALRVAERLVGELGPVPGTDTPVAIGVSTYPGQAVADFGALLRGAERAMQDARSRRGGIAIASGR